MRSRSSSIGALSKGLALVLLAAACGRGAGAPATGTPPPIPPRTPLQATPTPPPIPPPTVAPGADLAADLGPFPLDLLTIDPNNVERLVRIQELATPGQPAAVSGASLAFLPSYEHGLVGHFDDGQTYVWNIANGELRYQDLHPNDGSRFVENPPLAISPSFQGYLATAALGEGGAEGATARTVVVRPPDEPADSFTLPVSGPQPDETARVMGLAFSPDGHQLAIGLGGWEGGAIQLWDVWDSEDLRLIQQLVFGHEVTGLRFTPDGSALVAAIEDALVYLDPNDGAELGRRAFDFLIRGFSLSTSGETFAVWGDQDAVLESPGFPPPLSIAADSEFWRVAFTPDERMAVLADGGQLRFWDLAAGAELASFSVRYPIQDVAVLDNGRVVATVESDGRVSLWGVPAGFEMPGSQAVLTRSNAIWMERAAALYVPGAYAARLTPQGDLLVVKSSDGVYLVQLPSLGLRRLLPLDERSYASFDLSADGSRLAWVPADGVVRVWDLAGDRLALELAGLGETCCWQVRLSPDGRYLATGAGMAAALWDLSSGEQIYLREGVQQVHFSPDGSRVAFEQGLDVNIVELDTLSEVGHLTGFTTAAPVITTKFSPDWSAMYWAGRASMQFADVESGALGPAVPFSWGEFSPRGERIVVVEEGWIYQTVGQAHLLDVRTGETLAVLDHHDDAIIQAAAYAPDGRLIATALGEEIKIWDALSGAELFTLPLAGGNVHELAFSPDQRMLLSMSQGDLIELWVVPGEVAADAGVISVATAGSLAPLDSLRLEGGATDAVFSPDQRSVAVSNPAGEVRIWDLAGGEMAEARPFHDDWIYHLAYEPDGSGLASVSKDRYIRFRAVAQAFGVGPGDGEVSALAFFPRGEALATAGQDGMLRIWSMPDFRLEQSIEAHSAWVWGLDVSPSGGMLATASADRSVKLWSTESSPSGIPQASLLHTLTGHTATVWSVAFSPDGRTLASASWDGAIRLWDVGSGEYLTSLEGHTDWVYDVAYSPAGDLLASTSADGTIRLWDAASGESLASLQGSGDVIWSVDFSPDGRRLVSASDLGEVVIWGVAR